MDCVIFDIGGVLISQDLSLLARRLCAPSGQDAGRILPLFGKKTVREVETGKVSGEDYFDRTIAPLLTGISYEDWICAWMDNYRVNQPAWELLEAVRAEGRTVCLLSNLAEFNKIAIERRFPFFFRATHRNFFSYQLGLHKPDPAIYLAASKQLGVAPADCLFLDDVEENVDGARAAGMVSIWFDNSRIAAIRRALGLQGE